MKRTFERILFMIVGALIAFCAYLVGHIDSDLKAQDDDKISTFDTLLVEKIWVSDFIIVGDTDNHVFLGSINSNPRLELNSKKNDSYIELSLRDDNALLFMDTTHHNDHRTLIRLNTASKMMKKEIPEFGTPYQASISIGYYKHKEGGVQKKDYFGYTGMYIGYIKDKLGSITHSHPLHTLRKGDDVLTIGPEGTVDID